MRFYEPCRNAAVGAGATVTLRTLVAPEATKREYENLYIDQIAGLVYRVWRDQTQVVEVPAVLAIWDQKPVSINIMVEASTQVLVTVENTTGAPVVADAAIAYEQTSV